MELRRATKVVLMRVLDPAELHFQFERPAMFQDMESGRDLYVEPAAGARARCRQAEAELLAASVNNRLLAGRRQQVPEGRHVVERQWIDDRQMTARRDLDQTELGAISIFRNEFGIKSD